MPVSLAGLSLRDLEYAVAVGRERHFGRAAEHCHVSQAALSEQVRKLENLLGVALFERTKRSVAVTPRGAVLLAAAEALLGEARRFLEAAHRSAGPMTGPLRLGVIATLGPYYVPALIRSARERFSALDLRLAEGMTRDLVAQLRAGDLDAALLALPLDDPGFHGEPLFFEPFRLACPADHPLADQTRVGITELSRDDLLLMEEGHCLRDQTLSLCNRPRLDRHTRFASSLEMLRHMIAAGEGLSILPALAAADALGPAGLIAYRDLVEDAGRTIGLVWRTTETRRDDLETFAGFLRESLPGGIRRIDPMPAEAT
jgi:LysR family hydrogen peroxide-inducible transcriptional activator